MTVVNPHFLDDANQLLVVQSSLLNWGTKGWTATLRPTDDKGELWWHPVSEWSAKAPAPPESLPSRLYLGCWGGHIPNDFERQPVPAGRHTFVLSASGADDDYGGWARAFHQEAGVADSIVHVAAGTTSVVELRLRLEADSCVIEGAVRKFKCQIWN